MSTEIFHWHTLALFHARDDTIWVDLLVRWVLWRNNWLARLNLYVFRVWAVFLDPYAFWSSSCGWCNNTFFHDLLFNLHRWGFSLHANNIVLTRDCFHSEMLPTKRIAILCEFVLADILVWSRHRFLWDASFSPRYFNFLVIHIAV